jgi:SsrA-binding protein
MKIVTVNRKAFHDYEIIDKFEAGLILTGSEVKSLRDNRVNLKDAFVDLRNGEAFLISAHISPYPNANIFNHEPERVRKLLLNRVEIRKLEKKTSAKGFTIIPLRIYFNDKGKAKLEIALAKGKRQYEKRDALREKDIKREMDRDIKHRH